MARHNLVFKAGPGALEIVRRDGFSPELIGTIAGASGGAKWLVLSQLDRVILQTIVPRLQGPVHLIGTSIGAWRFACYAQSDPVAAIERFEEAYIHQEYSDAPDVHEITAKSREILGVLLGQDGVTEILDNPVLRTHIMTVRARHIAAAEQKHLLATALAAAASANAISRRALGLFFERALFFDARDLPPFFDARGFPLQRVMMRKENLEDAIVATGSIPLVLSGVRDIHGALPGVYRDGGVIDYHLDLPHSEDGRLALYPHFFEHIVPGWFDKRLTWRKPAPAHVDRTILISPSAEFAASLPNRKIPDRTDFQTFVPSERMRLWRDVVGACERLAEELHEVLEKGELESRLTPL
ncbi:MAG: patatin-like phospholipase family protein [Woeseiaceae bacterium]|nr:patatin-like phospholipase family protein [Woeseiaceae bacterium]